MKLFLVAAAMTLSLSNVASAGGNSETAKAMADVLSGTPGIGGVAPTVSGKNNRSASGWGNSGSAALSPLGSVTEGAKSQGKKK